MPDLTEVAWYKMMGLSKLFLKNFIIGSFIVLLTTVGTLATLLNSSNKERLLDERQYRINETKIRRDCEDAKDLKTAKQIELLEKAIKTQETIDREIRNLQKDLSKKK